MNQADIDALDRNNDCDDRADHASTIESAYNEMGELIKRRQWDALIEAGRDIEHAAFELNQVEPFDPRKEYE